MNIYGDSHSGNCLKVKWVSDHLALPYRWIEIDTRNGGSRTPDFLQRNPWGQVPTVEFGDGRALTQSNAIIRYLARDSALTPHDSFAIAKMDEWLFWEQYSHEPYVAVCRYQMLYLGNRKDELDPEKVRRGIAALNHLERRLEASRCLVDNELSLADIALAAYTRMAHEGGFEMKDYVAIRRWIGFVEDKLGLAPWPNG